jgi:hypothetical protein
MLRNQFAVVIENLLTGYGHDATGRAVLSAASALSGTLARQAIYQKDYIVNLDLDPADPARVTAEGLITTDQGYTFFATSFATSWDNPVARPTIYFRDGSKEIDFAGGPRGVGTPYQSAKNFGPAAAQLTTPGPVNYRIWNEPKYLLWMAGERSYFQVRAVAQGAPSFVACIISGFQFNMKLLERG